MKDVDPRFTQVYSNAFGVISKITAVSALHLLFWIISKMSDENFISLRKAEKLDFIAECVSSSGKRYTVSAVNKAIKILQDNDLIISHNEEKERRGRYIVSPIYFWKTGDQKARIEYIKEIDYYLKLKRNEKS